ncbi:putative CBL-interacting protein kinase 13 [Hordeum vulgare]|nr:putative CBL-interacting protein kinase 13 [Hordeum vulgare]
MWQEKSWHFSKAKYTKWSGLPIDVDDRCDHGSVFEKLVTFEDVDSGRRFLACSQKEVPKCNYVQWVDPKWPDALKLSLASIWSMHDEEKRQRLRKNVLNVEDYLKTLRGKKKIEDKLRLFMLDFSKIVAEKEHAISQLGSTQLVMVDLKEQIEKKKMAYNSITNIHQVFRANADKERDQAMKERDNLVEAREII